MIKTLDRYLLKEMAIPLLFSVIAIVFLFQLNFLILLFKHLRVIELPLTGLLQVILFKTPDFVKMTLVAGTALASSLSITRLTRESEIVALQSAGISLKRILIPIFLVGVFTSCLNFYVIEVLAPQGTKAARKLLIQFAEIQASPQLQSNVVLRLRNGYIATFGQLSRGTKSGIELSNIQLFEKPQQDEIWLYTAESGHYENGIWIIKAPFIYALKKEQLTTVHSEKNLIINEPISIQDFDLFPIPEEQQLEELQARIQEKKQKGEDTIDLEIAYYAKFAIPASCLVFGFLGPIFAIRFASKGPFVGVLLTMLSLLLYYNAFLISSRILGGGALLPPALSVCLPHICFISIGMILLSPKKSLKI